MNGRRMSWTPTDASAAPSGIGYASFWCDNCRYGLRIFRVEIPAGVEMFPFSTPDHIISAVIPDFEEIPYEETAEDEVFFGDDD